MSLNRSEQRIYDYFQKQPDERRFWQEKLHGIAKAIGDEQGAVAKIELELWRYYQERSAVAAPFKEAAMLEGVRRTSMKNLAELLLRLWVEPRPNKKGPPGDG